MKAVILATAMTIVLLALVTLALRHHPTPRRARKMMLIYVLCLIGAATAWFATSSDLGFLAQSLLIEPPWLDLSLMLFFFSAAFFGGVLQLYNLADRGLSLRVLIDFAEADSRIIDTDWLIANYGGGKGLAWMYEKRIAGMLETGLVECKAGMIALTPKGTRTAAVLFAVRRFLRLEPQS
jgi:hypothetical protein